MSRAKYYISFDNVIFSEFWPSNEPIIKYQQESNEIFLRPYVDKFKIGRTKNHAIYDDLYQRFFDYSYFGTDIYYKVNILGVDKFYFAGPITQISIDTQNSVFEAQPDPNDLYRAILQKNQIKWQDRADYGLFGTSNDIYYPALNTAAFFDVDFTSFSDDGFGNVTWVNSSHGTQYATNDLYFPVTTGHVVEIIITNFIQVAGAVSHMVLITAGGAAISNIVNISANGKYTMTATGTATKIKFYQLDGIGGSSGSFTYLAYYAFPMSDAGASLRSLITTLLTNASYMGVSLSVASTYLWNDALPTNPPPSINTYIGANPTKDYVIQGTANWNYLCVTKTDIWTTNQEDIHELCFKDLMDYLKIKLRAWWFIDDDGVFRIEHDYYFRDFAAQADLTSATYDKDKPEVDVKNYTYDRTTLYNTISYKEENEKTAEFISYPVLFDPLLTSENRKDSYLSYFSTDLDYLITSPGDASSVGFVLLKCDSTKYVQLELGTINSIYYRNAKLAWPYLFTNYYNYFAEAQSGTIDNGVAKTYTHVKEFLKQNNIKFQLSTDLDWKKPFTLSEGTGWLTGAEYNPETGMYNIGVGFNPYSIVIYITDDDITKKLVDDIGDLLIK